MAKNRSAMATVDVVGGFPYYGKMYYQIQVYSRGFVTFGPNSLKPSNPASYKSFPLNVPMLAPFWSDTDLSNSDNSTVEVLVYNIWNISLNLITNDFRAFVANQTALFGNRSFEPGFILVVNWKNVAPFPARIYSGWENATFQLILATDGNRSVAMMNYGRMLWNPCSDNRTVLIGITDGVSVMYGYNGDLFRPDLSTNVGNPGKYFFFLGDAQNNTHIPCVYWYQVQDAGMLSSADAQLVPCPCSLNQAVMDWRFVSDSNQSGITCFRNRGSSDQLYDRLCCYDSVSNALITGMGGGYLRYVYDEVDGKKKCCQDANLCQLFYAKRPSDNCARYKAPATAAVWGDPHFSSFSGEKFTFNGQGEFNLLHVADGQFDLQGRFENLRNQPGIDVTSFTAIAMKYVNYSVIEVRLLPNNTLVLYVDTRSFLMPLNLQFPGAIVEADSSTSMLIRFEFNAIIKLSVVNGSLKAMIQTVKPVTGPTNATGILVKRCPGQSSQNMSDVDNFKYLNTCYLMKTGTFFLYSMDGYGAQLFFDPNFTPTFFPNCTAEINSFCGQSRSCCEDFTKTQNGPRALVSKALEDELDYTRGNYSNFPPVFISDLPMFLNVTVGQSVNISLNATNPEGGNVRYVINTVINGMEYKQVANGVFIWTPIQRTYDNLASPFMRFFVADDTDISTMYWPYIRFCPCAINNGMCSFDSVTNLDMEIPKGRLIMGKCRCYAQWTGDFCDQPRDVCNPNPCYPGVNCIANTSDIMSGFICGTCPPDFIKDLNQCYSKYVCLERSGVRCPRIINTAGISQCGCDPGFALLPNRTCVDINECLTTSLCRGDGQFCHNMPGSFACRCRPEYYDNVTSCIHAPVRFGGQITFKFFNAGGGRSFEFQDSLSNVSSPDFTMVAEGVEGVVKSRFIREDGFVGVEVNQLQNGSIQANFDMYFGGNTRANASYLNGVLQQYLQDNNCQLNGPDCTIASLIGVSVNNSGIYDKDLCRNSQDNPCDLDTMNCRTDNGRVFCDCKPGFTPIVEYEQACEDVNECSDPMLNSCTMNNSFCVNTVGSYYCDCSFGYEMENGSCTDVCEDQPCFNGGVCSPYGNDYICSCVGIWSGMNCTVENPEAVRLRKIAIGIGVGLGILCLILIAAVIGVCVRQYRHGSSYQCATNTHGQYKGRRSINTHHWDAEEMSGNQLTTLDRESQPQPKPFTGRENPAYVETTLDRRKPANEYF